MEGGLGLCLGRGCDGLEIGLVIVDWILGVGLGDGGWGMGRLKGCLGNLLGWGQGGWLGAGTFFGGVCGVGWG